jgi:hypothetical protein
MSDLLNADITKTLGIEELSLEEQAAFLAEIGDVVFETSLVRLVSSLTEDENNALEQYLETNPEPEVLMKHLLEHYKSFQGILEQTTREFKETAEKVLGEEQDIKVADKP